MTDKPSTTQVAPPPLTRSQWLACEDKARSAVIASIPKPEKAQFEVEHFAAYPRWLTIALTIGLLVVAVGALYVSAGKQLAAGDIVLKSVLTHTDRVNEFWVSTGLIVLVVMGEIGALTFGLSAGLLAQTRTAKRVFRAFMVMSAAIALLANISMTASYPQNEVIVFQWFITILAPSLVLGVGFVFENLLMQELEKRAARIRAFNDAVQFYHAVLRDPKTAMPERYQSELVYAVGEALRDNCKTADGKRGHLYKRYLAQIEADPRFEYQCIAAEFDRHMVSFKDFLQARPM